MSNIVSLKDFKQKKVIEGNISKDRKPLHNQYITKPSNITDNEDFGDRMQRIRSNLEKINNLMADLKSTNKEKSFHD